METLIGILDNPEFINWGAGALAAIIALVAGKFGFDKFVNKVAKKVDEKIDD